MNSKNMSILLVGAFSVDSATYTYATSFYHTLCALGYPTVCYNSRSQLFKKYTFIDRKIFTILNTIIVNWQLYYKAKKLKPTLIFIIKGENITAKTLQAIKKTTDAYIVNFYTDNPFCLWNGNSNVNVISTLSLYDCCLTWSEQLQPILVSAGSKHSCYFPFAFDQDIFFDSLYIPNDTNKSLTDVCFVGTWTSEREKWLAYCIKKIPNIRIAIWGNQWDEYCADEGVRGCIKGRAIYNQELIAVLRSSSIVLNFVRQQNIQAHNMRTFEVPASGAFLLTQRTDDQAKKLFQEDENIVCFGSMDELVEKIIFYIGNPMQRFAIQQRGFERVQIFSLKEQLQKYLESFFNVHVRRHCSEK